MIRNPNTMNLTGTGFVRVVLYLFAAWMIVVGVGLAVFWPQSFASETVVVEDRWVKTSGEGSMAYLAEVDTDDGSEVMKIRDIPILLHFTSSDVYAQADSGETYCAEVSGWRFPVLSMYRTIRSLEAGSC